MDRTAKLLMAAIAAGLFVHAIVSANAAGSFKPDYIVSGPELREIAATLREIANGTCSNRRLCQE